MKLFLDVDGVINLDGTDSWDDVRYERSGLGYIMGISDKMITELLEVVEANGIELIWATTWVIDGHCETHLTHLYNIPTGLRMIDWYADDVPGHDSWSGCGKLNGVAAIAEDDEPIIWIDDCLGPSDYAWGEARRGSSLLIRTDPRDGITADDILEIEAFAKEHSDAQAQSV